MASIVYCDRVRHVVREARSDIEELIYWQQHYRQQELPKGAAGPDGFIYVTPDSGTDDGNGQIALKVDAITSFQGFPGDGI
jgi:hypothetical protein